jgi:EpsI family protein
MKHYVAVLAVLSATAAWHAGINQARHAAAQARLPGETLSIPAVIGSYAQDGPDTEVSEDVRRTLETSSILGRSYRGPSRWPIELVIVYAGSTRRSLHFPEVCVVGQGWEIREQTTMPVGFTFSATRLILVRNKRSEAVLYWYKTGDQLTGNFFANSWHWAYQQLSKGSATSAMIRVSTPIANDDEEAAFQLLEDFAAKLTPILMERVK